MNISDILSTSCSCSNADISSKKKVLEKLSEMLAECCAEASQQDILSSLVERERLGSTGVGNGIAIPHGRLQLENICAAILTTESPVDFDAIDNKPVDVFFAVLVPEDKCQEHIKVLSTIAKQLSDKENLKLIRSAENNDSLYSQVTAS